MVRDLKNKKQQHVGVYPGTFDPITLGHTDIIRRAARVMDKLVIGVARNSGKGPLFDTKTRVALVEREVQDMMKDGLINISVEPFENLLIDFARQCGASVIVRGLRAASDFEYEIQMAAMNYRMDSELETIFLTATEGTQFISSRFVKEIARMGGDVSSFVSPRIVKQLSARLQEESGRRKVTPEVRD